MRFLIFGLLFTLSLSAQYQQDYEYIHIHQSAFEDVIPTEDGCIVVGTSRLGNSPVAYIAVLDTSAAIVWDDTINLNTFGYALAVKRDTAGNIFVGGHYEATNGVNNIFCKKYSSTGAELWVKTFDSPGSFNPDDFKDMIIDAQGDPVLVGSGRVAPPYTNPLLLHYSNNGNLIKDTTFVQTGTSSFISAQKHSSGLFALSRKLYGTQKSTTVHRFNAQYQRSWSIDLPLYTNGSKTVLALNPQGYTATGGQKLTIGEAILGVCRPNGDTAFTRTVSTASLPYGEVINVVMDSSKYIYVLSRHGNTNLLSKYDTSGVFYWNDTLPRNSGNPNAENQDILYYHHHRLFYASAYINSDLVVYDTAGTRLQRTTINLPGLSQTSVTRVIADSSGVYLSGIGRNSSNQYRGFVAHFSDTTSPAPPPPPNSLMEETISIVSIYPSPASDFITIKHDAALREVWVYDVLGKEILRIENPENRVSVSLLAKGQYFLQGVDERGDVVKGSFLKK